jgi:hypothetical protein
MSAIPVNGVTDMKRIIGKRGAEEEEKNSGSLNQRK